MAIVSSSIDALEEQQLDKVNLGQHVLAEFFECDSNVLNSLDKVEKKVADDKTSDIPSEIIQKAEEMQSARKEKNWAIADKVRNLFDSISIVLKDTKEATIWEEK